MLGVQVLGLFQGFALLVGAGQVAEEAFFFQLAVGLGRLLIGGQGLFQLALDFGGALLFVFGLGQQGFFLFQAVQIGAAVGSVLALHLGVAQRVVAGLGQHGPVAQLGLNAACLQVLDGEVIADAGLVGAGQGGVQPG